jgi:hypothetical protein
MTERPESENRTPGTEVLSDIDGPAGSAQVEAKSQQQDPLREKRSRPRLGRLSIPGGSLEVGESDGSDEEQGSHLAVGIAKWAARRGHLAGLLIVASVTFLLGLAISAVVLYHLVPVVWNWGFSGSVWWKIVLGILIAFYLVLAGIFPPMPGYILAGETIKAYLERDETELQLGIATLTSEQTALLSELDNPQQENYVKIIRLSGLEMAKWTKTTLSQHRQSFFYAVLAMWIGFAVITVGVLSAFGFPTQAVNGSPTAVNVVVLASGALVELISALFLWVYRRSLEHFRYFYDQQMKSYRALMAYAITTSMTVPDKAILLIVGSLMERDKTQQSSSQSKTQQRGRRVARRAK